MRPYPNTGPQEYAISINGGVEPVWSPDGSELFYRSGDQVMVVAVDTTGAFRASAPTLLFAGNYDLDNSAGGVGGVPNYDVVPDGRLVMVKTGVYPDFPTIFRGFSEFFVGDLMGKALWKLVENAQRFPRRGGRVLCVHGPVSFHRARPCATKWPPRRGLRTGPPASSDCGRPVNDKCSHQHRRSVQAERSSCPGKTVISGTYAILETRI